MSTFLIVKFSNSKWEISHDGQDFQKAQRGPATYGPARQIFASPFAIVIPSSASLGKDSYDFYLRIALYEFHVSFRLFQSLHCPSHSLLYFLYYLRYIAYSHYFSVGTRVPIITDKNLLSNSKLHSLNLIILGGLSNKVFEESAFREVVSRNPISIEADGSIVVKDRCRFEKDGPV